jgi:hypothetical protein
MTTHTITISDDYVVPTGPLTTNTHYMTFIMNKASESYKNQYAAANFEAGITAAREAYNAALPVPAEEPVE